MNPRKTPFTALVVVPPEDLWGSVQAIRRIHDRRFDRWMPHVTLLYPFRPREEFGEAQAALAEACAGIRPFGITLAAFRSFQHRPDSSTLWLHPQPPEPLTALQSVLEARFPDCDDASRHPQGFTPHLSVGQARGEAEARRLAAEFQARWTPLSFEVDRLALLAREEEGPFRIERVVRLGGDPPA